MAEEFDDAAEPQWGPKTLAFLAAIRARPNITAAAEAAGVSRRSHYNRLERSKPYAKAFAAAWNEGVDTWQEEAERRAVHGVQQPVLYHGKPVMVPVDPRKPKGKKVPLMETEYSDTLLLAILRAHRGEMYREKVSAEVSGPGGGPIAGRVELVFVKAAEGRPVGSNSE